MQSCLLGGSDMRGYMLVAMADMSCSQYCRWQGHVEDGHKVLYTS